jgi:hypothetical protein
VTPEGFFDLTPFFSVGENTIVLRHRSDLSKYIFVLHAHLPTLAQLKEVVKLQERNMEWNRYLASAAGPLERKPNPFTQASKKEL